MAFAYEILEQSNATGRNKEVIASFTNGGSDTGGAISTGLTKVLAVTITHAGSAVVASAPVYAISGGTVTIVTVADADGTVIIKGI